MATTFFLSFISWLPFVLFIVLKENQSSTAKSILENFRSQLYKVEKYAVQYSNDTLAQPAVLVDRTKTVTQHPLGRLCSSGAKRKAKTES